MKTSTTSLQSTTPSGSLRQVMRRHPVFFFFFIAYAFSWILVTPYILKEWGFLQGDFTIAFILKSFGPFLAAYIVTGVIEGKEGLQRLRTLLKQKSAGWPWYLFILVGIPALIVAGIAIQPGALAGFRGLTPMFLVTYAVNYFAVFFGGGPLGEEPGWRGFALPRLQGRYGPLWGTLLLCAAWTCWHLPDFLSPSAQGGGPGTGFATFFTNFSMFLGLITALGIILTWIFNHTHGSIFIAILAHASVNTPQLVIMPLFPAVDTTSLNLAALIGFGVPALLILILTRGRLGYAPSQELPSNLEKTKA